MAEKINIQVKSVENKIGKDSGKKYSRIETDKGWFSCFDSEITTKLKEAYINGVDVSVEITEKGDYRNITKYNGIGEVQSEEEGEKDAQNGSNEVFTKDPVGLVVELICSGKTTEEAIKAVKQAQGAFL